MNSVQRHIFYMAVMMLASFSSLVSTAIQDRYIVDPATRTVRSIAPRFWTTVDGVHANWGEAVLGVYDGSDYDFRAGIFIELPPDYLLSQASAGVRAAVVGRQVDARVVFWHSHCLSDYDLAKGVEHFSHTAADQDNIVLHPLIRSWVADSPAFAYATHGGGGNETFQDTTPGLPSHDYPARGLHNFNISVPAGIFDAQNVSVVDTLGTNALAPVAQVFHSGPAFSGNVAHIQYTNPAAGFATFWLVALSPGNIPGVNKAYVSFNVVATNPESVARMKGLFPSSVAAQGQGPALFSRANLDELIGVDSPIRPRLNELLRLPDRLVDGDSRLDAYFRASGGDIQGALERAVGAGDAEVASRLADMLSSGPAEEVPAGRLNPDVHELDEESRLDAYLEVSGRDIGRALALAMEAQDGVIAGKLADMISS